MIIFGNTDKLFNIKNKVLYRNPFLNNISLIE